MQDRDLIIWRILNPELFVELASDEDCPNSDFFLSRLFRRVGDEIRSQELDPLTWKTFRWLLTRSTLMCLDGPCGRLPLGASPISLNTTIGATDGWLGTPSQWPKGPPRT